MKEHGRTMTLITYLLPALFLISVFGIFMVSKHPESNPNAIKDIISNLGSTCITAIGALGIRATMDSYKQNPTTKREVSITTSEPAAPNAQSPA